ncbi:VTT domain-containing protein [Legionella tunisiensis]|uniref:VTT domain-containing protein n=1 Tax=Legionella tunisiensis TaxID=1034944 RepID=UPI001E557E4D|nr:VTT domain-containing protein [Legionella tunisiensis]
MATDWFASRRGPKINKLISGVERSGWQFVALIRLIPIIPFNLVNYGLGLTQIKFRHYVITTFIF